MAYSHWALKQSTNVDFIIMALMVVFWFALYFQARINRKKCQPQMRNLEELLHRIVKLVVTKSFQHIGIASPIFIYFHIHFNVNLFSKKLF